MCDYKMKNIQKAKVIEYILKKRVGIRRFSQEQK